MSDLIYAQKQEVVDQMVTDYINDHSETSKTLAILAIKEFEEWKKNNNVED